jgi:triosephosphate isomerase (TIM)
MKILFANWKMNPQTVAEAQDLFNAIATQTVDSGIETVICPPFVFISELSKVSGPVSLGSQDLFWESKGAFTGEISPQMLKNLGTKYVLVGHSDRRYMIGETEEMINKKLKAALMTGITPVLLVGEREGENREEILTKQLIGDLIGLPSEEIYKILFTYEPVWAISTNPSAKPDTPENTLEAMTFMRKFIKEKLNVNIEKFLYGGSVNEKNVVDYLKHSEISGAIVGGASLKKDEFTNMIKLTSQIND